MMNSKINVSTEFNRSKIYEKLEYAPQPSGYNSKLSWTVQQQIAATNGLHYIDIIGKLNHYPVFELPVDFAVKPESLMLDIGCGWGRWLIAGANKGYLPIGMDLRLEFCQTALKVLKDLNLPGYTVVGDLENLPFQDSTFDLVWSFSVIQHTHYERLINCLGHINRILIENGLTKLEFPNKTGFRNKFGPVKQSEKLKDDYNNWCVRYYKIEEYNNIVSKYLKNINFSVHSFLGIGILKEDLKYVSFKNKIPVSISLILTQLAKRLPILLKYSDSIYITATKSENHEISKSINAFLFAHNVDPMNNLNIVHLLRCPKFGCPVELDAKNNRVVSKEAGVYYPIEENIPIMIASEAISF